MNYKTITITKEEAEALEKALQNAIRDAENPVEEENLTNVRDKIWEAEEEA